MLDGVCCGLAGNNAVEMQTTAEYDQGADEFIITTPTTLAQKYWVCPIHLTHDAAGSLGEFTEGTEGSVIALIARLLATHGTAAA